MNRGQTAGVVCVDGTFSAPEEARVPALDHGLLYGDGAFETLRTYGVRPFRLEAHLDRLRTTTEALGFVGVPAMSQLIGWVQSAVDRSGLIDAQVRITVTRGVGTRGWDPDGCEKATVIVSALPLRLPGEKGYSEGIRAVFLWSRSVAELPKPEWKSTSFQRAILARREYARRGAAEGFFFDEAGNVLEGATSNVFAVIGGVLWTPARGCLPGITRAAVIGIAERLGVGVRQAELPKEALLQADEVFVTSSIAELLPVVRIEDRPIGDGRVGAMTRRLHAEYRETITSELGL